MRMYPPIFLGLLLLLTACGKTGDLYLPEKEAQLDAEAMTIHLVQDQKVAA